MIYVSRERTMMFVALQVHPHHTPGELSLSDYQSERNSTVLTAYETFNRELAIELGAEPSVAAEDAKAFVDMQQELLKDEVEPSAKYQEFSETTLKDLYANADCTWLGVPQTITALFGLTNITLKTDERVATFDRKVTKRLEDIKAILETKSERQIRNYFGFLHAQQYALYTSRMRQLYYTLEKVNI
ncbi:hypothetical protein ElyMa_001363300 [Elysia marginata]|uniref:Peptidase M13 N-terminal domain-containing protein n=1 Tax=Elysia marginata TaxID=1093978 RepID=A0AAV4IQJ7_9GAST|nr:hypothetical protein ElyMa_001363300 [Elysia marginata]